MALELLSGPYTCESASVSALEINAGSGIWVDGVGIVVSGAQASGAGIFVIQPDGTTYRRGGGSNIIFMHDLEHPELVYARAYSGESATTLRSKHTFSPVENASYAFYPYYGQAIRTPDGWLSVSVDHVVQTPLSASGFSDWTFVKYYPIPSYGNLGISLYRPELGQIAFAAQQVGTLHAIAAIWDTNTNDWTGEVRYFGVAARLVLYARELGVWLVVQHGTPTTIRVFADSPVAAALSNPTALTSVASGKINRFRVRATGSKGEPVPEETVTWTASAGTLLDSQSVTDADGYATARYVAPLEAGDIEITAEIVV